MIRAWTCFWSAPGRTPTMPNASFGSPKSVSICRFVTISAATRSPLSFDDPGHAERLRGDRSTS